ncbi:hypothetical protein LFML04_0589 [Leptospirillum ferriphilum ML-04]|uniref:Uncharacterized protein n=1 Tax=Leptospirillum ferriphilum (strain ML-04) TaxID=1048260 RepID=J9Z8P3_LEPFM|nr:hypothetical protein LFML04_0589 [Leptospirillum ferriphilum ML-04]
MGFSEDRSENFQSISPFHFHLYILPLSVHDPDLKRLPIFLFSPSFLSRLCYDSCVSFPIFLHLLNLLFMR